MFRPVSISERGGSEPEAGVGITVSEPVWDLWSDDTFEDDYQKAMSGYEDALQKAGNAAAEKFTDYADNLKLFLVQFHGRGDFVLGDDTEFEIIKCTHLPSLIDQVWFARHDWVDERYFEITWERAR